MATVTWDVSKDARVALTGSTNLGAGATPQNQIGLYSGYLYRTLLGFNYSFAGMTAITAATLYVKTSSQVNVAFGASPDIYVRRLQSAFTEGTVNSPMTSSNAVTWANKPTGTATNQASGSLGTAENTWKSFNITALLQDAFAAGTFHGLELLAQNEAGGGDVGEIWAREYSTASDPYIVVTYTTNSAPSAPTMTSPSGTINTLTPNLVFSHVDVDGDALASYELDVSTDSTFASVTHWDLAAGQTSGISGSTVTRAYAGTALTRGVTYYWRARTVSGAGDLSAGAWSAATAFVVAQVPTVSLAEPAATGRLAKLSYTAGSGWASPRLNVDWTFSCPDGGTQASYEVQVYNDSGGAVGTSLYASGTVAATATGLVVPATLTEAAYYHVRARATCSHGETSAWTSYVRVRARWGVGVYNHNMGAGVQTLALSAVASTAGASSAVVLEYATAASAVTPTTWYSAISAAGLAQYLYYRVWLLAWGASPATSPSLDRLAITYSTAALSADLWAQDAGFTIDQGTYVYGTQSLLGTGDGTARTYRQQVDVTPNTNYVLSARLRTQGNAGAYIALGTTATGGIVAQSTAVTATSDWARVETPVWNSGANTSVWVQCAIGATVGAKAWFDAVKLEASKVVTPWTPSFLAEAVVLDAGGLQIDASNGGIFRLRTAGQDVITLNAGGLTIGRDGAVDSVGLASSANPLQIGPTSGANLVFDAAAVQARNNGAAATLLLHDAGGKVTINGTANSTANTAGLQLGADVNLYRSAADTLRTDDSLTVGGQLRGATGVLPYAMEAGSTTVSLSAAASAFTSITFTAGRFTQAPLVFVTQSSLPSGSAKLIPKVNSNITTSGADIYCYTGDGTTTTATVTVRWLAIQMTSGASIG